MNINYEDIMKALENGVSEQELAANFTKAMNDAIAAKTKKEAEEKAKKEAEERAKKSKLVDAQEIADMINVFLAKYYPTIEEKVTGEDLITSYDAASRLVDSLEDLLNMFDKPTSTTKRNPKADVARMDPITKFLRENDLLN